MVTIKVKGGTPQSSDSLCQTCSRGHIIKGFRITEEQTFCRYFYIEREICFPVSACTFYEDRRLASKSEMEEIAWFLTTRKPGRTVGFVSASQFREIQENGDARPAASPSEKQEK
ncbi:MAG: hypothetical protein NVS9B13_17800 [Candidatus Acidiferrum sp.]